MLFRSSWHILQLASKTVLPSTLADEASFFSSAGAASVFSAGLVSEAGASFTSDAALAAVSSTLLAAA